MNPKQRIKQGILEFALGVQFHSSSWGIDLDEGVDDGLLLLVDILEEGLGVLHLIFG